MNSSFSERETLPQKLKWRIIKEDTQKRPGLQVRAGLLTHKHTQAQVLGSWLANFFSVPPSALVVSKGVSHNRRPRVCL